MPNPTRFLMAVLLGGQAAIAAAADEAAAVIASDQRLNARILAHDATAAAAYYTDDFLLTTSSGRRKSKDELLAEIASPEVALDRNETRAVSVRVHGDTAVLTGVLQQHGRYRGQPVDATLRVTDTWVREGGRWRLLAGHASRVAEADAAVTP